MTRVLIRLALCCAIVVLVWAYPAAAQAATATVKVGKVSGPAGGEAAVPIHVQSKDEMGCMQFALVYDPAILEVKTVEGGPFLPAGATVDHNSDQAGWLRTGFICSPSKQGVKGEGAVLNVIFTVKGQVGQKSPLKLEKVRAWESSDPEILVQTEPGELTVVSATQIPWLYIAIGAGTLLVLLFLVWLIRRQPAGYAGSGFAPPTAAVASPRAPAAPGAALPRFTPEGATTIAHTCSKCGGVIQLPRAMAGQSFQCGACGAAQVGGQ